MSFLDGFGDFEEHSLESPQITKEYILSNFSQEDIFKKVFPSEISLNVSYKNPLRMDEKAGCRFYYTKGGNLLFHDLSRGVKYDCFSYMMECYNSTFPEVLEMIANTAGIYNPNVKTSNNYNILKEKEEKKKHTPIQIKVRPWNSQDVAYWHDKYGLTKDTLSKFNVYPVNFAWYGKNICYRHDFFDPCYAYRLGKYEYKLYFPFRKDNHKKHLQRFLTNTGRLQGYLQLPDKMNILCLTKSMKEVMCLDQFCGVPAVAKQGEGMYYSDKEIQHFKERAGFIFCFLDFDEVGVKMANKMFKRHGIYPLFLTNGKYGTKDYGSKDLSDYIENNGTVTPLLKEFKVLLKEINYEKKY